MAANAATSADESRSSAVSAELAARLSLSAAKSSAAAAEIFAEDATTAASSSSSARASAISARDIAVNSATSAESSVSTINLTSIAVLNPSRVGTDESVWAYEPHGRNLNSTDSRFVQTGTFPNNSFITDDATFGNAFVFPDTLNKSFGPRLSFAYGSDKVYLMTVTYRTVQDSDTLYSGQYGVRTLLGATTRGDNGVTLAENIQDFEQRTLASAGETVFAGVIHGEDYTDAELDSLPIITSTLTTNQDSTITDRITTAQTTDNQNAGASGPATSISFAIRQNAGESTTGQLAVKSFEVRDLTDIVKSQLATASAQRSASAANSSRAAAGISETNAAQSESNASSAAASALSSKELSANSETAAANSASAANSARGAAVISQVAAANSESNASASKAAAIESKNLAANSETAARLSASSASASKAAAALSELNAANSESNASSSKASALSNKELSASSATLAGTAKDLAVSAQNAATEQAVENQNLIATGGFIGKNTFEDDDEGRWTTNDTPLIADEGLPAHPLGRTRAYKSDARDAYYSALNTNQPGFYEQSAHGRTFKFTGYCYNANVAGEGRSPVHARAGLRTWNGNSGSQTSNWPTIIAASAATTGWVYYSGTLTVNDPDGAYLAPFLQNGGVSNNGDTLLSYWTDMTMEDVTASESARKSASAANSARAAALISETAAASSATSANSAEGAAEASRLLAASAQLVASNAASSAESARAAAEIFESDASQAKVDAEGAEANAEIARGLSVNAQTAAQNSASVASAASQASAQKNLNVYFFSRDSEGRGWSSVTGTGTEGGDPYLEWSDTAFHLPAYDNLKVGDVYRLTGQYNTVGNSHNCKFMFREENGGWIDNGYEVLEGDNTLEPGTSWSSFNILLRSKINRERFTIAIDTADPAPTDDRLKVKNLLWVDVTEEYNSARSASSAQSSFGAADIARSGAVNAKTTASSASVSANEAKKLAVSAKTVAETAANGAQAAQAAALISEQNSANAETTATQAAVSASSNRSLTVQAKLSASSAKSAALSSEIAAGISEDNAVKAKLSASSAAATAVSEKLLAVSAASAADASASGALVSRQSASAFASQLSGELSVAVEDVNRIAAEVQTGLNGHYILNNLYIGYFSDPSGGELVPLGDVAPKIEVQDVVTNSTNNEWGTGSYFNNTAKNLSAWVAQGSDIQRVTNGANLKVTGTSGIIYKTISGLSVGSTYKISYRAASTTGYYQIFLQDSDGTSISTNLPRDAATVNSSTISGTFVAPTTSISFGISASNPSISMNTEFADFFVCKVLNSYTPLDYSNSSGQENIKDSHLRDAIPAQKHGLWKVSSPTGVYATFGTGSIGAIPENMSSDLLSLSYNSFPSASSQGQEIKAVILSPFSDSTVNVYVHTSNDDQADNHPISFIEGTTPVNHTFTVKKGQIYSWNSTDIVNAGTFGLSGSIGDNISLVFKSSAKILGYSYVNNSSISPLVPLSNAPALTSEGYHASREIVSYPRFITGGGINLHSLESAIYEEASGQLQSQAPNLSAALKSLDSSSLKFADLNSSGSISSSDADYVEQYRNVSSMTLIAGLDATRTYRRVSSRINALIEKLDSEYSNLETTFTSGGQTKTLYNTKPVATPGVTINGVYAVSNDTRTNFALQSFQGQSSIYSIPLSGLSDLYIHPDAEEVLLASVEPTTILVYKGVGSGTTSQLELFTTVDHSLASKTNPLHTRVDGLVSTGNVIRVVGDAPFYAAVRDGSSRDYTIHGARQDILSGDSGVTAFARRVTETTSTLDTFSATITETAESIDGLEAQYAVKINNNGFISGFGLSSTSSNSPSSAFIVQADRFAIIDPATYSSGLTLDAPEANVPFEVSEGTALIKNAFISKLGSNNITVGGLLGTNISATSKIEVFTETNKNNTYAALDGSDPIYRFYVGNENPGLAPFSITSDGSLTAASLHYRGDAGNYFSSSEGLGIATLSEIGKFISEGRRFITQSDVIAGDFDSSDSSTYAALSLTRRADVYQKYRLPVDVLSYTHAVSYYSVIEVPLKLEFGTLSTGSVSTKTASDIKAPLRSPTEGAGDSFTYSSSYLNRTYLTTGEVLQLSWSGTLQNGTITVLGATEARTGNAITGLSIGTGTSYENSITVKMGSAGQFDATINKDSTMVAQINNTISISAAPDLTTQALNYIPTQIKLKPIRKIGSGTNSAFMSDIGAFNSEGELVFQRIGENDNFGDNPEYQYRVIFSNTLTSYNEISITGSIDSRFGAQTGGVDNEGYLTAWTSTAQTDEFENDGVPEPSSLDVGSYKFGLVVEFNSGLTTFRPELNTVSRTIETEGLTQFGSTEEGIRNSVFLTNDTVFGLDTELRNFQEESAYGLSFSGCSYTVLKNDFIKFDGHPNVNSILDQEQALILGNVSDSVNNTNKDHLFVVAVRPSSGDYVKKMHLTADGKLYIGNTGTDEVSLKSELNTAKTSLNASITSLSSRIVALSAVQTAEVAKKLDFGDSNGTLDYTVQNDLELNLSNNADDFLIKRSNQTRFTFDLAQANFTAAGNVTAFSDERLKSDIKTLDGNKVLEMRGVEFIRDGVKGSGVIAQELEKIAPELVHDSGEYKSVAYANLTGYLIEAVKKQQKEIEELKNIIYTMRKD